MSRQPRRGKIKRWKFIRKILVEHPMRFSEIQERVHKHFPKITTRVIQYDLADNIDLGDIEYAKETGLYSLPVPRELSRSEYEIALQHSRRLLFTQDDFQGFDQIWSDKWLDTLLNPDQYVNSEELKCLLQHLKKGYHEEFWHPFQEYRDLRETAQTSEAHSQLREKKESLIKTLRGIMKDVENGILLKKSCDRCPIGKIPIKDELSPPKKALIG